jgi:hypothetical protein
LSLENVSCARLPRDAIALLASLRTERGMQAALTEQYAWIRWEAGNEVVLRLVLPIHDAVLFHFHDGRWHQFGQTLPAFDFPADLDYQPLAHVLFPAPVQPIPPLPMREQPLSVVLKREDRPRKTTALLCPLSSLLGWSDTVPTARLTSLQAIHLHGRALVFGVDLPPLIEGTRFWGRDVLIPLGYVPDPALPESTLKEAAGLQADEMLLWQPEQIEVIERAMLSPLTRAGLRLSGAQVGA